jgi:WD40 repeat protein
VADVFISYSRRDASFAHELAQALKARGKESWIDVQGIQDGEVFPAVLRRAVEEAHGLVYVISPDAVRSSFCQQEVDHALALGKRVVPVLHRPVPDEQLPAGIRERQWVRAGERLTDETADRLSRALDADPEHTREHTRLLVRARDWDEGGRRSADLPRGDELARAEAWLTRAPGRQPAPTTLHSEWIAAARAAAAVRQRRLFAFAGLFMAVALGLLVFALVSRGNAVRAEGIEKSEALATQAENQVSRDPQRALLLARVALAAAPTAAAELATSEALDANTVRAQLPSFGVQGCLTSNYMYLLNGGRDVVDNTCDGEIVFGDLARRRIYRRVKLGVISTGMTLSADERTLLLATGRRLLSVDIRTARTRLALMAPWPIAWTAAGRPSHSVAISDGDNVGLVDFRHERLRIVARGDPRTLSIVYLLWASPDELLIATSGQSAGRGDIPAGLSTLNVVTGARRRIALPVPAHQHLAALNTINIAPDLRTWFVTGAVITANSNDQVATTWAVDARTGRVRWITTGPNGATAGPLQPSTDGRLLGIAYSQGAIDVLDAATGRLIIRDTSSSSIIAGWMDFPPGGRSMVTVSLDGVFRIWAAQGSEKLRFQAPPDPALDFTPDGRDLVLVGDHGEIVDRSGRIVQRFPGFPAATVYGVCNSGCFAASPQLRWLTYVQPHSATPRIVEIDGRTGRRAAVVPVARLDAQGVTPDGRVVASWVDGDQLHAQVIDPRSLVVRNLQTGQSNYGCAATTPSFTPGSRYMAIVDGCINVFVWDLRSGRLIRRATLKDRANASGALGGGTTASGAHLTPDGHYVLVTLEGGGLVRIDVASGRAAERLGTQTVAKVVTASPNGRFYAVGREDGTIDEYDARTLELVRHHTMFNPIEAIVFSPDSSELAVEDTRNVVQLWDTCDICENPRALAARARQESVRSLTSGERATFGLS